MTSEHPEFDVPSYPGAPSGHEQAGTYQPGAEQPRERPAYDGPAPSGGRMMPNDYPPHQRERQRARTPLWVKLIGGCLIAGVLLTAAFACALAVTAGSAVAFFSSTPVSATNSQTFAVAGIPTVRVQSTAGNIQVVRGNAGAVVVQATKYVRGFSGQDAQTELRKITVTATQSGDTLDVKVNEPGIGPGIHLWWTDEHVDLTISVPAQANIAATLDAGNVDVTDIAGTVNIQETAGNVRFNDVSLAGSSSVRNSAGNIDLTCALQPGASLDARNSAGNVNVTIPRDTSAHLTASTTAGNVNVDSVWPVSITRQAASATASGDLNPNPTGTLILESTAGNVNLSAE